MPMWFGIPGDLARAGSDYLWLDRPGTPPPFAQATAAEVVSCEASWPRARAIPVLPGATRDP